MKCPLFIIGDKRTQLGEESDYGECLGTECGWWDAALELCAPVALNTALLAMGNVLGQIHTELCLSRVTFTCHDCGLRITRANLAGEGFPVGWIKVTHVDGRGIWLCDSCMASGRY